MPGYIARALHKFQNPTPNRPEHAPHAWYEPVYGRSTQFVAPADDSPLLDKAGILRVQAITDTSLFYARAVKNHTALVAIDTISTKQSKATDNTNKKITRLLNYFATHPNAIILYHRSGMVLYIHSDASYLSEPNARSHMGGHFFLSSPPLDPSRQPLATDKPPPDNGAIHVNSTILKVVVASAAEAETGAMFYNSQDAVPISNHAVEFWVLQVSVGSAFCFSLLAGRLAGFEKIARGKKKEINAVIIHFELGLPIHPCNDHTGHIVTVYYTHYLQSRLGMYHSPARGLCELHMGWGLLEPLIHSHHLDGRYVN
jgi:hypothetical protein